MGNINIIAILVAMVASILSATIQMQQYDHRGGATEQSQIRTANNTNDSQRTAVVVLLLAIVVAYSVLWEATPEQCHPAIGGKPLSVCAYSVSQCSAQQIEQRLCKGGSSIQEMLLAELKPMFPKNAERVAQDIGDQYRNHFCFEDSPNYIGLDEGKAEKPLPLVLGSVVGNEQLVKCMATRVASFLTQGNYTDLAGFQMHENKNMHLNNAVAISTSACRFSAFTVPILDLPLLRMYDFHDLCDENSAMHKTAIYIMTLIRPKEKTYTETVASAFDPDGNRFRVANALAARVFPGGLDRMPDLEPEDVTDPCS